MESSINHQQIINDILQLPNDYNATLEWRTIEWAISNNIFILQDLYPKVRSASQFSIKMLVEFYVRDHRNQFSQQHIFRLMDAFPFLTILKSTKSLQTILQGVPIEIIKKYKFSKKIKQNPILGTLSDDIINIIIEY